MDIGQVITQIRKRKSLSQAELAKLIDITQASLSHIESGKKVPHKSTIQRICNAVDIPEQMFYFLCIEEQDIPDTSKDKYNSIAKDMKELILSTFS